MIDDAIKKLIDSSHLPYFVKPTNDGRLAFYVDNHMITTHNRCERKFYLQHILNLRPKGVGGFAMSIGGWWSSVLEDFYNRIKLAQSTEVTKHIHDPQVPYFSRQTIANAPYPTREAFIEDAAKRWREAKMDLLADARPKMYKEFGGTSGAALMAMSYYDTQGRADAQQWRIVEAEAGFGQRGEVLLHEDKDIICYYTGKPDLIAFTNGGKDLMPIEHKTIHRVVNGIQNKYKPFSQVAGYIYSVNTIAKSLGYDKPVDRAIVNITGRAMPAEKPRDGVKKSRFTRVFPTYTVDELEEWKQNVVAKTKRLHYSLINNEWIWKESECHLYAGCEYRGIDSRPPGVRPLVVASDYVQVEAWTPYVIEDEDDDIGY